MKILVACEESQRVCMAFRDKGHIAWSCDIEDCSGGHPEWHIKADVLPLLDGNCDFTTCDGVKHRQEGKWDMIIAFPPCTHLAVSGARHFEKKREDGRQREAVEFFCQFLNADCDKIVIENPVGIMSGDYVMKWFPDLCETYGLPVKPTQYIQPCQFGHNVRKKTGLWLKGVEPLQPTEEVEPDIYEYINKDGEKRTVSKWFNQGGADRQKERSKTFMGVALAMAAQWG